MDDACPVKDKKYVPKFYTFILVGMFMNRGVAIRIERETPPKKDRKAAFIVLLFSSTLAMVLVLRSR